LHLARREHALRVMMSESEMLRRMQFMELAGCVEEMIAQILMRFPEQRVALWEQIAVAFQETEEAGRVQLTLVR
jgi:hypothetical protein